MSTDKVEYIRSQKGHWKAVYQGNTCIKKKPVTPHQHGNVTSAETGTSVALELLFLENWSLKALSCSCSEKHKCADPSE